MRHPDDEAVLEARRADEATGVRDEHVPLRVYFADLVFLLRMGALVFLSFAVGVVFLIV